ncbi:MAG: LacI family DNA-binding transcriptional regulator [Acidimicrobiales bacterium]
MATRAGVSLATASYALGDGRRSVSEPLRSRVIEAAKELGYELRPRGRRQTRSLVIAAVVPDATNSFFADALRSIEGALRRDGHMLVVASSGDDPGREDDLVRYLRGKVDGLVLAPAEAAGPAFRELAASAIPVVVMDRDSQVPEVASVSIDNRDSARRATRLLAESRQTGIAIVNGPLRVSTARDRLAGYLLGLEEAGLSLQQEFLCEGEFSFAAGRQAVHNLLRLTTRPGAIFSTSAILTSGVLFGLKEHGLCWPDDIAVVGFGDAIWASLVEPTLTVIEQPTTEMGETAVRLLLARTRPPHSPPHSPQHVVLSSNLVLRESHWHGARKRGSLAPALETTGRH